MENNKEENKTVVDEVCSFENIYSAIRKCRRGTMWKDSTAGFVKHGLVNAYKLEDELKNDKYKLGDYIIFDIYEPKQRQIVSTRFRDRVVQKTVIDNYLIENVTKSFVKENCACQVGKGTDYARNLFKQNLCGFYRKYGLDGYILKCDVKNYFGSTPHEVAIEALTRNTDDEFIIRIVEEVINSFTQGDNPDVGVGLGSEFTQLAQLAVLSPLDHFIKEKLGIKYYVRYMDDFILIHHDKEHLKHCKAEIERKLAELGLKLHETKTQLFKFGQPVKFLGFTYRVTDTGKVLMFLDHSKISKEKRKLRKQVEMAKQGKFTKQEVDSFYQSFRAHALKGNTRNLITKMDKYYKELWSDDNVKNQNGKAETCGRAQEKSGATGEA